MAAVLGVAGDEEGATLAFLRIVVLEGVAAVASFVPGTGNEGRILIPRDFEPADGKRLLDSRLVLRSFVRRCQVALDIDAARAHQNLTRGDHHHLRTVFAFLEGLMGLKSAFLRL